MNNTIIIINQEKKNKNHLNMACKDMIIMWKETGTKIFFLLRHKKEGKKTIHFFSLERTLDGMESA